LAKKLPQQRAMAGKSSTDREHEKAQQYLNRAATSSTRYCRNMDAGAV
jgi:hypothetical protein